MNSPRQIDYDNEPNSVCYEKICLFCGKQFLADYKSKHCSKKCVAEKKRLRNYKYRVEAKKDKKLSLDKHILNNIKSSLGGLLKKLKGL